MSQYDSSSKCAEGSMGGSQLNDNWKHRSKGMKCRTCMYYVEKQMDRIVAPDFQMVGRCRRHAPTMNGWPVMRDGDWCGDHKLDENKA